MLRRAATRVLNLPLPTPPDFLRRGPLRAGFFRDRPELERTAHRLGTWLGVTFTVCLLTGVYSHLLQSPPSWFSPATRPVQLYRVSQGVHVITGLAAVPLLLAKLATVFPRLFVWPPAKNVGHALERGSLLVLVGGSVFQLSTGVMNVAGWYAFGFNFRQVHYWTAWVVYGSMLVHIALKAGRVTAARLSAHEGWTRRQVLTATATASATLAVTGAGQTVPGLSRLAVLGTRDPHVGAQGRPVNRSAAAAGVTETARSTAYRLEVVGGRRPLSLDLTELRAMRQASARLPIACVEGWSFDATWTGVRVADLMALADAPQGRSVRVESLQQRGAYSSSELSPRQARDPLTLLALELDGEELHIDHGFPCRLIAPARPGVLQTKWVARLVVLS